MERAPNSPAAFRWLFIDLDDTLFDHVGSSDRALRRLRAKHPALQRWSSSELLRRHSAHLEAIHPMVLEGRLTIQAARAERMRRLFDDAGESLSPRATQQRARELRLHYQELRRPVAGAATFLRYAHRRARVTVVTNNLVEEQREKLAFLGLAEDVDDLVTSEEIGAAKPDPRIFEAALALSGADPGSTLVLGDSFASDVRGARGIDLPVVWFNRFAAPPPDGEPPVPELRRFLPASAAWAVLQRAWRVGRSASSR